MNDTSAGLAALPATPLSAEQLVLQIRDTDHAQRADVTSALEARTNAGKAEAARARNVSAQLKSADRIRAQTAWEKAERARNDLEAVVRFAQAAGENNWSDVRNRLITSFQTYHEAILDAEAAIGISTPAPGL